MRPVSGFTGHPGFRRLGGTYHGDGGRDLSSALAFRLQDSVGDEAGGLPRLQLDELLDELEVRIDAVRGTRDRVHNLLEVVLSVDGELDLTEVLRRIVEAAVVLVDAEYGALGVIEGDRLSQFLTSGISDEQAKAIGPLPSGHGVLGELIRHGVGLPEQGRRSGLHNLAERAAHRGGDMTAAALEEGGTRLVWRVRLPPAQVP